MKFLFDLFPVILFFVAFKFTDIYIATAVAIVATFLQIGWVWMRRRKVDGMLWVSLVVITVFGGMTLFLHDETFDQAARMSRLFADPRVAQDLGPRPPSDGWKEED